MSGTCTTEIISSVEVLKTALAPISRGVLSFDLEALDRGYGANDAFGREVGSFSGMTSCWLCWLPYESCELGLGRTI